MTRREEDKELGWTGIMPPVLDVAVVMPFKVTAARIFQQVTAPLDVFHLQLCRELISFDR